MFNERLSEEQIGEFKKAFDLFDKEGKGVITTEDLGTIIRALGQNPTEAELKQLIDEVDTESCGTINCNKFLNLMSKKVTSIDDDSNDVFEAFRIFDKNGDGFIPAVELRHVLTNLGEKLSNEEVDEMFRKVEIDEDGLINYDDLVTIMTRQKICK